MSAPNEPATNAASAPVESEYDKLMNHEYDGIREYDNPLPFWWVWLWAASVFFSVGYVAWFHMGNGATIHEQYTASVTRAAEMLVASLGEIKADDATILDLRNNEELMTAVAGMFRGNCAQCHGNEGGGNIGPNLTDDFYKNVRTPADFYTVIADGVPGTSMTAWGSRMREPQLILLASYVASLRGTSPSGDPLPPDGNELPAWSTFEVDPAESDDPIAVPTAPTASADPGDSAAG